MARSVGSVFASPGKRAQLLTATDSRDRAESVAKRTAFANPVVRLIEWRRKEKQERK